MKSRAPVASLAVLVSLVSAACTPGWKQRPYDTLYQQTPPPRLHPKPATGWRVSDWWDFGEHAVIVPLAKSLSPARWAAAVVGNLPSLDVNAFGKVLDSPWFENRITRAPMSAADLQHGPNNHDPPPRDGTLLVLSGKTEGNTPGLVLRDRGGTVWFVKFDPPAFREMATSAEIIATRFLHAAGYFVPETYLVDLDVARLRLSPRAWSLDEYRRKKRLDQKSLDRLIALMNPDPGGHLRALFSRKVPGVPLGPFSYRGVRVGDPNDRIPHQRRRSLRGLWVLSAWLNNTDVRRQNTLDTWIPVRSGRAGFIRHYLIDFGDALGAAGDREKYRGEGYEARIDWSEIAKRGFALGLYYPYWVQLRRSPFRSVGIFESDRFDPDRWQPVFENPAFSEATPEDSFWGASILARFTPDLIAAGVATAHYSEPGAAAYVTRILIERRAKLLRYAFRDMIGLDEPRVEGHYTISFLDLELLGGLVHAPRYRYRVLWNRTGERDLVIAAGTATQARFDLRSAIRRVMLEHGDGFRDDPFLTLEVRRGRDGPRLQLNVRVVRDFVVPVSLWRGHS